MTTQPFHGIRVIEFGQFVAVPFCGQLLAEGGADVIKIESLDGDPTRRLGQLADMETRIFISRNRGKRSLPLHLRHPDAPQVIDTLLRSADVALMNFRPGLAEQLGLDADTLRARYPTLITAAVTPFGRRGPDAALAGMDIVVQARSGLMVANGRTTDGRPASGDPVAADYMCAMTLAFGVASALLRRANTGDGAAVHASLMQAAMTLNNNQMMRVESVDGPIHAEAAAELARLRAAGADYPTQRAALPYARARSMADIYFRTYDTADGWLAVACGSRRLRQRFIEAIGLEDPHAGDEGAGREQYYDDLRIAAEARLRERPTAEWERALAEASVPASRVLTPMELLDDPQTEANAMLHNLQHPAIGPIRLLSPPVTLDDDGFRPQKAAAPFASQTRPILRELGFEPPRIDALIAAGATKEA